jgi:hypothetical protein
METKKYERTITNDVFVNAAMLPFEKVCDYPSKQGMENVILSNGKIVNIVSDSYGFINNEDLFKGFENILNIEGINFEVQYKNVNDCQFIGDYFLEGEQKVGSNYKGSDIIKPKIRLQNSYDGKLLLSGYFGFFRQVCSNGLHVHKNELAFKIRRTKEQVQIVFPRMSQMLEDYRNNEMIKIHTSFEELANIKLNANIEDAVKDIADNLKIFKFEKSDKNPEPSKQSQFVIDTIIKESNHFQTEPTAWLLYNAFNEWIYNDNYNSKDEGTRKNLDVKLFEYVENVYAN